MRALGIVDVRPELGVMIEMPPCELARRDAARNGVRQRERALGARMAFFKHGVMQHFV